MDILFTNNASALTDSLLLIDGLSVVLDDSSKFPTLSGSNYFIATIQNPDDSSIYEIIECTSIDSGTDTATIRRAKEGTSAREWPIGSLFEIRITAGAIDALKAHERDHISGGSAEVDGDQIDIDWTPSNYTNVTTPDEVTSPKHLTAHLFGIDKLLAQSSESARGTVELATAAEGLAGTDQLRAVTPAVLIDVIRKKLAAKATATYTTDHTVLITELGMSLRMNSASNRVFTMCSLGASEDGGRITFTNIGTGRMTIQAVDPVFIDDGTPAGTIYTEQQYASVTLEYVHLASALVVVPGHGAFTTT